MASELNAKSERKDDELQRLRAELDGLKKLMSDDLQVAVDSIATRGPFINIDVRLWNIKIQMLEVFLLLMIFIKNWLGVAFCIK